MKGKRSQLEFEQHELRISQSEGLLIHHLKKPGTFCDSVKFINTEGLTIVTGDYGNWMLCRSFVPTAGDYVSDGYWKEKIAMSSTQETEVFDSTATRKRIMDELAEEGADHSEEELEYLDGLLGVVDCSEFEYTSVAFMHNCGRFSDGESVPFVKTTKRWLLAVFDAYDEICRRLWEEETLKTATP